MYEELSSLWYIRSIDNIWQRLSNIAQSVDLPKRSWEYIEKQLNE